LGLQANSKVKAESAEATANHEAESRARMTGEYTSLEQKLSMNEEELAKIQQALDDLKNRFDTIESEKASGIQELRQAKGTNESLTSTIDSLRTEAERVAANINQVNSELA